MFHPSPKHDSQATTRLQLYSYHPTGISTRYFQQMAGLTYYYNTRHFYYLFMSWEESLNSYVLNIFVNDDNRWSEPLPEYIRLEKGEVWLRATVQREKLNFSYSIDGNTWQEIGVHWMLPSYLMITFATNLNTKPPLPELSSVCAARMYQDGANGPILTALNTNLYCKLY